MGFILAIEIMMFAAGLGALFTGYHPLGAGRYTRGLGSRDGSGKLPKWQFAQAGSSEIRGS